MPRTSHQDHRALVSSFLVPLSFADSTSQKYGSLSQSAPSLPITFDDIELSVIAAFIGLAVTLPITYLIVDRIIDNNEKKKLGPIEKLAKERLRTKLGVGFLTTFLNTLVIHITIATREKNLNPKDERR